MPRNTLPILIRYITHTEPLSCIPLACQDVISFNECKPIDSKAKHFDEEKMDGTMEGEGDEFKAFVTHQEEDKEEIDIYSQSFESKIKEYARFIEEAQLASIQPVRVHHCPQSHGVVISSKYGSIDLT